MVYMYVPRGKHSAAKVRAFFDLAVPSLCCEPRSAKRSASLKAATARDSKGVGMRTNEQDVASDTRHAGEYPGLNPVDRYDAFF